jgi:hypothetical protein
MPDDGLCQAENCRSLNKLKHLRDCVCCTVKFTREGCLGYTHIKRDIFITHTARGHRNSITSSTSAFLPQPFQAAR